MENEVKEPAAKYNYISPQEYLEIERATEHRNEYYDGYVVAMSGASLEHSTIDRNLIGGLHQFLKGKECEVLPSHMRVTTPSHDSYMYPDALIVCGKPELEDDKFDTLTNPSVIFEILSPSAKNVDKKRKFFFYREIPSLREYIMIDSTQRSIIVVRRQPDDSWKFEDVNDKGADLFIQTINFRFPLSEIYEGTGLENELKEPAPKYNHISPEEYLEMERASDVKHEYFKGEVFLMSGAFPAHNDIAYNINRIIAPFLHEKGCKLYGSDFRIYVPENSLFTYPDFSIVCGKAETPDTYTDNLANPTVIIEILSKSTKDYDRGAKFNLYRTIKTLKEYLLIDSTSILVESYRRQSDNSWLFKEFLQPPDSVFISAIGLSLSLNDVYEDVNIDD